MLLNKLRIEQLEDLLLAVSAVKYTEQQIQLLGRQTKLAMSMLKGRHGPGEPEADTKRSKKASDAEILEKMSVHQKTQLSYKEWRSDDEYDDLDYEDIVEKVAFLEATLEQLLISFRVATPESKVVDNRDAASKHRAGLAALATGCPRAEASDPGRPMPGAATMTLAAAGLLGLACAVIRWAR